MLVGPATFLHKTGDARTASASDAGTKAPHLAPPKHIVVVDDDISIRTLLVRLLRTDGFDATAVDSGRALRRLTEEMQVDLVLLDIALPDEDGLEVCASLRDETNIPVILVSARGQEVDRVAGLDRGADDYIAKPFGHLELLARVRAVLRRRSQSGAPAERPASEVFRFSDWTYWPRRSELLAPSSEQVELTGAEHELLLVLLRNPHRTIGRERLLELARCRVSHASDRSIDVLVSRLRRKLGDGVDGRRIIQTIRGVGYKLIADVETH